MQESPLNKELEEYKRQANEEFADEIAESNKATFKPLFKEYASYPVSAVKGTAKGAGNAVVDIFQGFTDMAAMSGAAASDIVFDVSDEKIEETVKAYRAGAEKITDYLKSKESGDKVEDFFMNVTESVGKFAVFQRQIAKAGFKKGAQIAGAGFMEGFTDAPEKDLLFSEKALRNVIQKYAPDHVVDYDRLMDINTDSKIADNMVKRIMSGLEVSMLSVVGEKVGEKALDAIPKPFLDKMYEVTGKTMDGIRKAKEYAFGDETGAKSFDDFIKSRVAETDDIVFTKGAMTPDMTPKEKLGAVVTPEFSKNRSFATPEEFDTARAAYDAKLEELAPQIHEEVVSMAKSHGLSEKEELAKFLKGLGADDVEAETVEGLKKVLKAQSGNILFSQEVARRTELVAAKQAGAEISDEMLDKSTESLLIAASQRQAIGTSAGRTLRTMQELSPEDKAIYEATKGLNAPDSTVAKIDKDWMADPELRKKAGEKLDDIIMQNVRLGGDDVALTKALDAGFATTPKEGAKAFNYTKWNETVGRVFQVNVLSSPFALFQGATAGASLFLMRPLETAVKGVLNVTRRVEGGATLSEAWQQLYSPWVDMADIIGHSVKLAKQGKFKEGIKSRIYDIPEMNATERAAMFLAKKTDLMPTRDNNIRDMVMRFSKGDVVFDVIGGIDTTVKSISARTYLRGRFNNAIKNDDTFGLYAKYGAEKGAEVAKTMSKMFREGREVFSKEEMKTLGISKKDNLEISERFSQWNIETSKAARQGGLEMSLQQDVPKAFEKMQEVLQDYVPLGRVWFPFLKSPFNWINEQMKRAPVIQFGSGSAIGIPVHPSFYKDFMAGGLKRQDAIARATSGVVLAQAGMMLAEEGKIQGAPIDNKEARAITQDMNMQLNALRIGDTTVSLNGIEYGQILFGAQLHRVKDKITYMENHLDEEANSQFVNALMYNLTSQVMTLREQPWMAGIDSAFSFLETLQSEDVGNRLATGAAGKLGNIVVPYSGMQRAMSYNFMEEQTKAYEPMDAFFQQWAPYLNSPARSVFGRKVNPTTGIAVRLKEATDSPVEATMLQLGIAAPKIRNRMVVPKQGVKIEFSPEHIQAIYDDIASSGAEERIGNYMRSKMFENLIISGNIDRARDLISAQLNHEYDKAKNRLIASDPELQDKVAKAKKKKLVNDSYLEKPAAGQQSYIPSFGGK